MKKISHEYVGHKLESFEFEECKGCRQVPEACGMITTNNVKICPCIKCLVKVTCMIHCEEYNNIFTIAIGCSGKWVKDYKSEKWDGSPVNIGFATYK